MITLHHLTMIKTAPRFNPDGVKHTLHLIFINSQMNRLQTITKRYMTVDGSVEGEAQYPSDFIESRNLKFIHVLAVHLWIEDENGDYIRPSFVKFHSDFVQVEPYLDHFICVCNQQLEQRKKYEQVRETKGFKWWLTDYKGQRMELNNNVRILIELMLEY